MSLCEKWFSHSVLVCEHKPGKNITCPPGTHIDILYALYGRQNASTCRYFNVTNCKSDMMERVYEYCQGNQTCFMLATNAWFGDPCYGTEKYLEIEYQCIFDTARK